MIRWIKYLLIFIGTAVLIYITTTHPVFRDIINTILISFIIAYSLKPIQQKMVEKGISRRLSAIMLLLGLFASIALILIFLIPNILKETLNISSTFDELEGLIENINKGIERLSTNPYLKNAIGHALTRFENIADNSLNNAFDSLFEKSENILSYAVIPILIYYILSDTDKISKSIIVLVPHKKRRVLRNLGKDINNILSKYILSQFLLSGLISVMTFIILIILGVEFPLLLSILNGIFNIIPYFGPFLGALPAIIVALLTSTKTALWTALLLNLLQQIEGDIISPKITGETVNMHPLFIILLLILGGKIGGFVGMVLAVPVAVIIKVILEDLDYYMY